MAFGASLRRVLATRYHGALFHSGLERASRGAASDLCPSNRPLVQNAFDKGRRMAASKKTTGASGSYSARLRQTPPTDASSTVKRVSRYPRPKGIACTTAWSLSIAARYRLKKIWEILL